MRQAQNLLNNGELEAAKAAFRNVLKHSPEQPEALYGLGVVAMRRKRWKEAVKMMQRLARSQPNSATAYLGLGDAFVSSGEVRRAESAYAKATRLDPENAVAFYNRGRCLSTVGQFDDAMKSYREALRLQPSLFPAAFNLGAVLSKLGRYSQALEVFEGLLARDPANPDIRLQVGRLWQAQGRPSRAQTLYREILSDHPNHLRAQLSLAISLAAENAVGEAEALISRVEPEVGQGKDAASQLSVARAMLADAKGDKPTAIRHLTLALESGADSPQHIELLAEWLSEIRRRDKSVNVLKDGLARFPGSTRLALALLLNQRHLCEWRDTCAQPETIVSYLRSDSPPVASPFALMSLPGLSCLDLQRLARHYSARFAVDDNEEPRANRLSSTAHHRLRIGYLSADFHEHATAYLAASVFEQHDQSRYEVFAYSYGPDDGSEMRGRLIRAFEHFIDIRDFSRQEAQERILSDRLDILVDLKGYTRGARPEILAARGAPLQVSWLGYPGTMGASFIDYLVADETVIPPSSACCYDEAIAYLPDTYAPIDQEPAVPDPPAAAELGLPEGTFVFCCFNNPRKITPELFDVWCRILRAVPRSVLWLFAEQEVVISNLRRECTERGLSADRLVWAPKLDHAEHLSRLGRADLVLDTLPYNAHTTAADALRVGVPVLTFLGETFPGRVAASLLRAAGLNGLITTSLVAYEQLAIQLATDRASLAAYKEQLVAARSSSPYFDSSRFTSNLERLYKRMYDRWQRGLPPESLGPEEPC